MHIDNVAGRILKKIVSKGWNAYAFSDSDTVYTAIPRGPAEALEIGKQYVLFPSVSNSRSLPEIERAIKYLVDSKVFPLLLYNGKPLAMPCFRFEPEKVVLHSDKDYELAYEKFCESLDSLMPTAITN